MGELVFHFDRFQGGFGIWDLGHAVPCLRDDDVVEWGMAVPEPGETEFDHHYE